MRFLYCSVVDYSNEVFAEEIAEKYSFAPVYRRHGGSWIRNMELQTFLSLTLRSRKFGGFWDVWFVLSRPFWNLER